MLYIDQIKTLWRQLMPSGRAFRGPVNGWMDSLNNGLSISENKAWLDTLSTFDSAIPDNINGDFTAQDCSDWERRLGLIDGTGLSIPVRLQLILQQYNFPGAISVPQPFPNPPLVIPDYKPRGFYLYVQNQLRAAGFDVYVYENRFLVGGNWVTKDPLTIIGSGATQNELADHELGDAQLGGGYDNIIANSIDPAIDARFNVGANLYSTFFIGGNPLGTWAYVPVAQLQQFRQLILKLKPVQAIGFLFVQYV